MTPTDVITTKSGLTATLYLADCLAVLPTLGRVDAVITDPPYGVSWSGINAKGALGYRGSRWGDEPPRRTNVKIVGDDAPFDPAPLTPLAVCAFTGAQYFYDRLPDWRIAALLEQKRCLQAHGSGRCRHGVVLAAWC